MEGVFESMPVTHHGYHTHNDQGDETDGEGVLCVEPWALCRLLSTPSGIDYKQPVSSLSWQQNLHVALFSNICSRYLEQLLLD